MCSYSGYASGVGDVTQTRLLAGARHSNSMLERNVASQSTEQKTIEMALTLSRVALLMDISWTKDTNCWGKKG